MSLLADLLSKVKQQPSGRDIPQNLRNIVSASAARSTSKKKLIIISIISAVAVAIGIISVYILESFNKVEFTAHRQRPDVVRQPEEQGEKIPDTGTQEADVHPPTQISKTVHESSADIKQRELRSDHFGAGENGKYSVGAGEEKHKEYADDTFYKKELSEKSAIVDTYLYAAEERAGRKDYSGALSFYRKALEIDGQNFAVMNSISYILLNIGSMEEAIKYAQMSLDISKDYVPAMINLGIASARSNDIPSAETYLNRAIALEPDNKTAVFNLAVLYESMEDYPKASVLFSRLFQSGDAKGSLGLARVYERQGLTEDALKVYGRVLSLSQDDQTRKLAEQRISVLSRTAGIR